MMINAIHPQSLVAWRDKIVPELAAACLRVNGRFIGQLEVRWGPSRDADARDINTFILHFAPIALTAERAQFESQCASPRAPWFARTRVFPRCRSGSRFHWLHWPPLGRLRRRASRTIGRLLSLHPRCPHAAPGGKPEASVVCTATPESLPALLGRGSLCAACLALSPSGSNRAGGQGLASA